MASRLPLVLVSGQIQQLQTGDTVSGAVSSDPFIGSQAPGAVSIATGQYAVMGRRLIVASSNRVTIAGTGALVISG